jgi:outer membrane biosynthesis protein TonB
MLATVLATSSVLILDASAWAQQESPLGPLPGQPLERPETPLWLTLIAVAVALGALGLVALIAASYLFLSRRFFGKEEAPPPRRQAVRIPPGAGVPPPARAVGHPVSETTPQGAGATGTQVAAGGTATATAERPADAKAEPAEKEEAAEQEPKEKPAEEKPPEEKPAEEKPAEEKLAEEKLAEEKPAPARHSGPAELDQETFDRVRQEQLDKGASPKVAEGRARAAAVKAAREKAGAG